MPLLEVGVVRCSVTYLEIETCNTRLGHKLVPLERIGCRAVVIS